MQTSEESAERPRLPEKLERPKQEFVLVPTDKAANKIGFIYKKYFPDILLQETKSPRYVSCQDSVESVKMTSKLDCIQHNLVWYTLQLKSDITW